MEALICDACARSAPKDQTESWAVRTTLAQDTPVVHYCRPQCEASAATARVKERLATSRPAALNRGVRLVNILDPDPDPDLAAMPNPVSYDAPPGEEG